MLPKLFLISFCSFFCEIEKKVKYLINSQVIAQMISANFTYFETTPSKSSLTVSTFLRVSEAASFYYFLKFKVVAKSIVI